MCRILQGDYIRDKDKGGRYQLRYAAGLYWLIDMEQSGDSYNSPVPLNEGGAEIWRMFESKMSEDEICGRLCEEYDISLEQAKEDVHDFVAQLGAKKVFFGGTK